MTKSRPNRPFNERLSPPVTNRKLQALQLLRNLRRNHHSDLNAALADLGFDDSDFDELCESLYQELVEDGTLEECGCCGGEHRKDFCGDCRNDDERFP